MSFNVTWNSPESTPNVPEGEERLFWIAVRASYHDRPTSTYVRLAHYQNRPLIHGEDGEPISDDYLVSIDGDPMESIGWVSETEHDDFNDFYRPIEFSEVYEILAWTVCEPPAFTGVNACCPDCNDGQGKCKFPFDAYPPRLPNTLVTMQKIDWPVNYERPENSHLGVYKYCMSCGRPSNYGKNDEPN